MLEDNETRLTLTKDPKNQNRTKHINIIDYHIQELVENRELAIKWVTSSSMLADNLTILFPVALFKKYRDE